MRSSGVLLAAALAAGLSVVAPAEGGPDAAAAAQPPTPNASPARRPNIVLVTIDSLRPDHLGCYAGTARKTPAIDNLAARGIRFTRVYAASPSTAPSTASILTGLYPSRHGLRHDLGGRLDERVKTLAEGLRAAGYATAAVIGSFHLDSDRGLDRGFETYDDAIPGIRKKLSGLSRERQAGEVVERGLRLLQEMSEGKPFFLWLNLFDPHYDYDPPEGQKDKFKSAPYDGEVAYLDAQLGGFVNGLRTRGVYERTLIVLAGSHGEGLGDHGETGHGIYLYESTLRVPLVISGPGVVPGTIVDDAMSLADLTPSVLELAGLPPPAGLDGRSLTADDPEEGPAGQAGTGRILFSETTQPHEAYGWASMFAVVQGDRKIVQGARTMAFDLRADAGEARPIAPLPSWAAPLLDRGRAIFRSPDRPSADQRRINETVGALRVPWDNSPTCVPKERWPDPRDAAQTALQDRLFRARIEADHGLPGSAAGLAEEILRLDPANFTALDLQLAMALRGSGFAQVADRIEILQCNYPGRGAGYHYLGHYYLARKEPAKAIPAFKLMASVEPWNEEADYDLAVIYAELGSKEESFAHLKASIRLGAKDYEFIRNDPRLAALRSDPRFQDLLGPVRTGAEKAP